MSKRINLKPFSTLSTRQKYRRLGDCKNIMKAKHQLQIINNKNDSYNKTFDILENNIMEETLTSNSINDNNSNTSSFSDTNVFNSNITVNNFASQDTIIEKIRNWTLTFNISQSALTSLLCILKLVNGLEYLPANARSLMRTPRSGKSGGIIKKVDSGKFAMFGFMKNLHRSVTEYYNKPPKDIKVNINIDGVPLVKSSGSQFWPILGAIVSDFYTKPFIIGIFHGFNKPKTSDELLVNFVNEASDILQQGILFQGENIPVSINAVICDAPAKAFVTGTVPHMSYYGCSKCVQKGARINHRMTFPELNSPLRTDADFQLKTFPQHHKDKSLLENLNLGMVSQLPLDYMHLICLGVTKRLIRFWISMPPLNKKFIKFNSSTVSKVDNYFSSIKSAIICEFSRKPRSIREFERWKATELRQFLLYTGPVVLKDVLTKTYYEHFLLLSIATRILSDEKLCFKLNNYANSLLRCFVKNFSILYGKEYLVYNVHNLIHIADDVKNLGPLDKFSAFKFENHMQFIKSKIKVSREPLTQICNRILEQDNVPITFKRIQYPIIHYERGNNTTITRIAMEDFILSSKNNNCYVETHDGSILKICSFYLSNSKIFIVGKKFMKTRSFFTYPSDSEKFGICLVHDNDLEENPRTISLENVKTKCLKLPMMLQSQSVIISLIHY